MTASDSIDGLGLTWADLTPDGKFKALFTTMRRLEVSQVRDAFMAEMSAVVDETAQKADKAQEIFGNVGQPSK